MNNLFLLCTIVLFFILISFFALSQNLISSSDINQIQKIIAEKIAMAKDQANDLNLITKKTKNKLAQIDLQIIDHLKKYYIIETQGILPLVLGVESIEDYIFRGYMLKQIAQKNQVLFNQYLEISVKYEERKQEADLIEDELTKYQQEFHNSLKGNLSKAKMPIIRDEIANLTDRQKKLANLINDLPETTETNSSLPTILNFKGYLELPEVNNLVKSVFEGKIVYVGLIKGFGNTIIVDHGNSVHSVYANFAEAKVIYGDFVKRGQIIAKMEEKTQQEKHPLHFEIRLKGIEQNTAQWLGLKPVR